MTPAEEACERWWKSEGYESAVMSEAWKGVVQRAWNQATAVQQTLERDLSDQIMKKLRNHHLMVEQMCLLCGEAWPCSQVRIIDLWLTNWYRKDASIRTPRPER